MYFDIILVGGRKKLPLKMDKNLVYPNDEDNFDSK